jgi:hypothetical protein
MNDEFDGYTGVCDACATWSHTLRTVAPNPGRPKRLMGLCRMCRHWRKIASIQTKNRSFGS